MSKYFLNATKPLNADGKAVKPKVYISTGTGDDRTAIWLNGLPRSTELAYHTYLTEIFGSAHIEVDVQALLDVDGVDGEVSDSGHMVVDLSGTENPTATLRAYIAKVDNATPDEAVLAELRGL
jgi:hypothetical protein